MLANRIRMSGVTEPFVKLFTSSQVWQIPPGVGKVDITVVGGGCGGEGGTYGSLYDYAGDGCPGGYVNNYTDVDITLFNSLSILIGAGGNGHPGLPQWSYDNSAKYGTPGADSNIKGNGSVLIAEALGGTRAKGGSGGGTGGEARDKDTARKGGKGGSDGGGGWTPADQSQKTNGQGTTTRGVNDVLYAGGGGGGAIRIAYSDGNGSAANGAGGAGGGGAGGASGAGVSGTANTGGGGGGGYSTMHPNNTQQYGGGAGGSGLVIIKFKG